MRAGHVGASTPAADFPGEGYPPDGFLRPFAPPRNSLVRLARRAPVTAQTRLDDPACAVLIAEVLSPSTAKRERLPWTDPVSGADLRLDVDRFLADVFGDESRPY